MDPTGSGPQQPIQPPVTLPGSMQPGWLPPPAPGYRWDADRRTGQWAQVPATPLSPARPPTPRERWGWFAAEPGEPSVAGLHPRWLLVALAVLILLPVCTCISLQSLFGPRYTYSSPSVVYIAPTETPLPTLPPTPTNTPTPTGPRPIDTPTLGGTQAAFAAAYGQPYFKGPVPWWDYTTPEGWRVTTCFCGTTKGVDGKERVEAFGFYPTNGVSFTADQTGALLRQFLPHDATHVRDFTDPNLGVINVYQSADLAATFDASHFRDSNGGPNPPPGTLSVACHNPAGPGCDIVVGT